MSYDRDDHWIDVSALGDPWEVGFNTNVNPLSSEQRLWRYRSARFGAFRTDWEYGRPPTGVHAK